MLTRKAALVLSASVILAAGSLVMHSYAAALAAVALWVLFAVNAFSVLPPKIEVSIEPATTEMVEDQRVEVDIHVENGSSRHLFLEQRLSSPETFELAGTEDALVVLEGQEARDWSIVFRPRLLGGYEVGPLDLRVRDPSSFRAREHEVGQTRRVLVLPRREDLKTAPVELGETIRFFGAHEASHPGDGFEFYTLRPWEQGDTIRMVNWRATARSDELIVNQRARESFVSVAVLLDATAPTFEGRLVNAPFACCARAVATLVDHLIANRDEVSFHLVAERVETIHPQAAERQLRSILRTTAMTKPAGRQRWDDVIDDVLPTLKPGQPVVLASPFETDPTVIPAIRQLAAREHQLLALSAPTDLPSTKAMEDEGQLRARHRSVVKQEIRRAGGRFVEVGKDRTLQEAFLEAVMA